MVPDNITEIASYAFKGFLHLTEIIIPDTVRVIQSDAFGGDLSEMRYIYIPSSVEMFHESLNSGIYGTLLFEVYYGLHDWNYILCGDI